VSELDIPFTSAVRLRQLYQRRTVAPHEVVQALLAQIDAVNPKINAVVTLARESALQEARRATAALRRGRSLPPLFGVPVGIKDVTPTKGIRTTYGSKLFADHVPDEDALVVQRLRAASMRLHPRRSAGWAPDRGQAQGVSRGAPRRGGLRGSPPVGSPHSPLGREGVEDSGANLGEGAPYFTLPAVRPPTRWRSIRAKSTTTGTMAISEAAKSWFQC
jgi:Amidase